MDTRIIHTLLVHEHVLYQFLGVLLQKEEMVLWVLQNNRQIKKPNRNRENFKLK